MVRIGGHFVFTFRLGNNPQQQANVAKQFRYYPTKQQLEAFTAGLSYYYQHSGNCFIHCAGGIGRTTMYLISFLMQITGESFDVVYEFVKNNYHEDKINEVANYKHCLV